LTSALAARRWALIVAPVVAGALTIVGTVADPAPDATGEELVAAYADDPDSLQFKSLGYHFAYTLWLAAALGLVGLVRRRGSWLANVAGLLAILGISTIPGFLVGDFVDSAMGRLVGIEEAVLVGEDVEGQWGFAVMQISGLVGFLLALPLAAVAAWRAKLTAWWAPVAVVAGLVAFIAFGATLPGNVLLTLAFAVFAVALSRIDHSAWRSVPRDRSNEPRHSDRPEDI
jgi:hypothetical protein